MPAYGFQVATHRRAPEGGVSRLESGGATAQRIVGDGLPGRHPASVRSHHIPLSSDMSESSESASATVPRARMLATVRNRSSVVAAVEPFDGDTGRLHLVHVEYKDSRSPAEERLLWELEPCRNLLEPDSTGADAMPPEDFDALLRAARWTAPSPYLGADGHGPPPHEPLASPFHGAVRPDDYQLVPLPKGAPHAARQPADRGRRRTRQDHRIRADPDRAAAPAPHPPRPGACTPGPPLAMARRRTIYGRRSEQ